MSGFGNHKENTGLSINLHKNKIRKVYIVGLAFDFSLGYTAEDSAEEGYETYIVKDATRSVDPDDEEFMHERVNKAGVHIINSQDILNN